MDGSVTQRDQSDRLVLPARDNFGPGPYIAFAVVAGLGHLGSSTMPVQVGILTDSAHLSATDTGFFSFCQIASMAFLMMVLAPYSARIPPVWSCTGGAVIVSCANLILYFDYSEIIRICIYSSLSGIGYGLLYGGFFVAGAGTKEPDRIYSFANAGSVIVTVAVIDVAGLASTWMSRPAAFLAFAAVPVVLLPCILPLAGLRGAASGTVSIARPAPVPTRAGVVALLVLWVASSMGMSAVWIFAERAGRALHMSPAMLSVVFSTSIFAGILGSTGSALLSRYLSRQALLVIGLTASGIGSIIIYIGSSSAVYVGGMVLFFIAVMFAYPILMGVAAAIDPTGRTGALAGGCDRMAFAVSGPVAGIMIDANVPLVAIGILGFAGCVGVLPFTLPAIVKTLNRTVHVP
ncbi:hypothetical protein [Komagataeibacter sp. FNDCF1]|uniref:hypothetical protein n=1 Tax=Komagataeibacter sp. FNDCF1 TaxID=2878681 RepID=UPI001E652A52|nr:hypothetical protein [Komagataeibacter sp. FNDCF1]MCE2565249.1 hypothetical protein [Komagataeibacter sp. FNDCF1]